jgi:hypothetical protein
MGLQKEETKEMTDIDKLKKAIIEICRNKHGKSVLLTVNNKRDYKEIATKVGCNPSQSSSLLNKATTFGLIKKEGTVWKKTPEFRHLKVNQVIKEGTTNVPTERKIGVKKRKKKTNTVQVKKDLLIYLQSQFSEIPHPFSYKIDKISRKDLARATEILIENLECDGSSRLKGLAERFYESFSAYFSSDRIRKSEFTNSFSNLIGCFEPYVKKVAAIKTGDPTAANPGLNKDMVAKVISFSSNINNHKSNYWVDKPIHEASLRTVFPYRHMESHEARDYPIYNMERIIFYLFASIIFINLNY